VELPISNTVLSRIGFAALVLGLVALVMCVVWGGAVYPDYDHARQFMSELGATGSTTGTAVSNWGFVPNGILVTVFCVMAAWMLRHSALAVIACLLLALNGVGMAGAGVFPCDFECGRSDPTVVAQLHDLFAGVGYLCAITGVGVACVWAFRIGARWLAVLSVITVMISVIGFTAIVAEVELAGLFQRAMETALAVFMLALGWLTLDSGRVTTLLVSSGVHVR